MKTSLNGGTLTVFLDGEIDHHSAPSVRNTVDEAVMTQSPSRLALDFSSVSFMDSSGIGLIMGRYKLMNGRGGVHEVHGIFHRRTLRNGTLGIYRYRRLRAGYDYGIPYDVNV